MFTIGREYIFRIKNKCSSKGYSMYTGTITDITVNKIFVTTVKDENISIDIEEIMNSFEKKEKKE